MRIRSLPILALPFLLAACATPQQRAERMQAEMAEAMVTYGPACSHLGYTPNSDPWRECVLQLSTRDEVRRYGPSYYGGYGPRGWRGGGFWGP